jgi:hypothetical protein
MPADFYKTSSFRVFDTEDWSVSSMISLTNNTIIATVEAILVDTKYHQHHSYNCYVLAFHEDGSQAWTHTVQKKQSTIQGLAGHILVPAGENVLVIYNDNEENIKKKPEDPKVEGFQTKNGMTVVQEIDPAGKVTKYPMTKDADMKGYMIFFSRTARIEDGLYYSPTTAMKSAFSISSRNITFQVK